MKLGYLSLQVAQGSWKRYWVELVAGSVHILSAPGGSVIGDVNLDQVTKILCDGPTIALDASKSENALKLRANTPEEATEWYRAMTGAKKTHSPSAADNDLVTSLRTEITQLVGRVKEHETKVQELSSGGGNDDERVRALVSEVASLRQQKRDWEEREKSFTFALGQYQEVQKDLEAQVKDLQAQVKEPEKKDKGSSSRHSSSHTKEKLKQKEEELVKANQLIEKLLATNKELQDRVSARETELQNLRKANPSTAPLHEKIAQLEEQLKAARFLSATLKGGSPDDFAKMKAELTQLKERNVTLEREVTAQKQAPMRRGSGPLDPNVMAHMRSLEEKVQQLELARSQTQAREEALTREADGLRENIKLGIAQLDAERRKTAQLQMQLAAQPGQGQQPTSARGAAPPPVSTNPLTRSGTLPPPPTSLLGEAVKARSGTGNLPPPISPVSPSAGGAGGDQRARAATASSWRKGTATASPTVERSGSGNTGSFVGPAGRSHSSSYAPAPALPQIDFRLMSDKASASSASPPSSGRKATLGSARGSGKKQLLANEDYTTDDPLNDPLLVTDQPPKNDGCCNCTVM